MKQSDTLGLTPAHARAAEELCDLCHERHEIQRITMGEMHIKSCPNIRRYAYGDMLVIGQPDGHGADADGVPGAGRTS